MSTVVEYAENLLRKTTLSTFAEQWAESVFGCHQKGTKKNKYLMKYADKEWQYGRITASHCKEAAAGNGGVFTEGLSIRSRKRCLDF